jgi:hypothetical protein
VSRVYVAVRGPHQQVLAYYASSAGAFLRDHLPPDDQAGLPRYPLPTAHLGRLAVDLSCRGQRLGELLLFHFLKTACDVAERIGVFAVDLFSKDDDAKRFYQKYGFIPLQDDPLSSLFADGNSPGDVRTGGAEFTRCDQGGAWSSSIAKQGPRSFLSGWKILNGAKASSISSQASLLPSFHPHSAWYIPSFPHPAHGGSPMPFDDPACFRLDRIPVRSIHWLWRPYLACGRASPFSTATSAPASPPPSRRPSRPAGPYRRAE